jgi:hypothetical protein
MTTQNTNAATNNDETQIIVCFEWSEYKIVQTAKEWAACGGVPPQTLEYLLKTGCPTSFDGRTQGYSSARIATAAEVAQCDENGRIY